MVVNCSLWIVKQSWLSNSTCNADDINNDYDLIWRVKSLVFSIDFSLQAGL